MEYHPEMGRQDATSLLRYNVPHDPGEIMKKVKDLLNKTADDLKKMPKNQVHEGYKEIIGLMLMDFYTEASNLEKPLTTVQDCQDFIKKFIDKHIKPPSSSWQPGDHGK